MNAKTRWIVAGIGLVAGLAAARVYGPSLHPCSRVEASICEELGAHQCALWRQRGRPGMPQPEAAFRGRGRKALADAVLALVLDWDPRLVATACRHLADPAGRATLLRELEGSLH